MWLTIFNKRPASYTTDDFSNSLVWCRHSSNTTSMFVRRSWKTCPQVSRKWAGKSTCIVFWPLTLLQILFFPGVTGFYGNWSKYVQTQKDFKNWSRKSYFHLYFYFLIQAGLQNYRKIIVAIGFSFLTLFTIYHFIHWSKIF